MPTILPICGPSSNPPPLLCGCPACGHAGPHGVVAVICDGESQQSDPVHRLVACADCKKPFLALIGPGEASALAPQEAARWMDPPVDPRDYQAWVSRFDQIGPADRDAVRRTVAGGRVPHVALRLYDDDHAILDGGLAARADIAGQFHRPDDRPSDAPDLLLFLHADAVLRPHAVFLFAEASRCHPDAVLFYGDEDRLDPGGERHSPFFKPAFSLDLFQEVDLLSACFAVRPSALADSPGAHPRQMAAHLAGSLPRGAVHHIPHILHHAATDAAAARCPGVQADGLETGDAPVTVIIPTHAQEDLLTRCVESLYRLNRQAGIELIIVDNSRSPAYRRRLDAIVGGRDGAMILEWPEPFNFSRMMNAAAARASGRLLCFLNDDTEGISSRWLDAMAAHARRPDIGAVGARLLYPDGSIQHAGVVLTGQSGAAHLHQHVPAGLCGHGGLAGFRQEVSAVTGACLVVEAAKFRAVGGFDDAELPVNFSDVDLCLKLRARGFHTLYLPEATLHHHESVSRSARQGEAVRSAGQKELHRLVSRWQLGSTPDPFHNPNLSTVTLDGGFAWPPRVAYPWPRALPAGSQDTGAVTVLTVEQRSRLRLERAAAAFQAGQYGDAARIALAVLLDQGVASRTVAAAAAIFGLCAEKAGGPDLAERFLREAVRRDPVRVEHQHNLGNLLARMGRRAAAAKEFKAVLARNPYFTQSVHSLAATLAQDGDGEPTLRVLVQGCTDNPTDARLWLALAEAAWKAGSYALCLAAAYQADAAARTLGALDIATRALACSRAVFETVNAGHRVAVVESLVSKRALILGRGDGEQGAGEPAAAQIAERRRALLTREDSSGSAPDLAAAEQRLADTVRRCDIRSDGVRFSVVMPVYRPAPMDLEAAIASVRRQSHTNWELCIAMDGPQETAVHDLLAGAAAADQRIRVALRPDRGHIAAASNSALHLAGGAYLALLDQDDELHPDALRVVADAVIRERHPHILFSDEDRIDRRGRRTAPHVKKGWDPLLMLHQNAVSHLGVFRRDAVERIGGFRLGSEGSQDHDLVLRLMRDDGRGEPLRVVHIPHILYHWRTGAESTATSLDAKPYALTAGRAAVQDHVASAFPPRGGRVVALRARSGYRVLWPRSGPETTAALVLTAVVTAESAAAAAALLAEAGAEGVTAVIAATTGGTMLRISLDGVVQPLGTLEPQPTPASVRRQLAAHCLETFLLFCHPALRFDAAEWVRLLLRFALGTGCVAVGPKLVDGAGHVVSCGVTPDQSVIGRRYGFGAGGLVPGYFGRLVFPRRVELLDELCVLMRRDAFERIGGLGGLPYVHGLDLLDTMMRLRQTGDLAVEPEALAQVDAASRLNPLLLAHTDPGDALSYLQRWWLGRGD